MLEYYYHGGERGGGGGARKGRGGGTGVVRYVARVDSDGEAAVAQVLEELEAARGIDESVSAAVLGCRAEAVSATSSPVSAKQDRGPIAFERTYIYLYI